MKLAPIIFGLVGVVLLAAIIIPTGGCGPSKETNVTRFDLSQAQIALALYNQDYGHLPTETDNARIVQILEGDNPRKLKFYTLDRTRSKTGEFLDGWDKPLLFKTSANGIRIRSAGKDGIYYTKDDLTQETQIRVAVSSTTSSGEGQHTVGR